MKAQSKQDDSAKEEVKAFWNEKSCAEGYMSGGADPYAQVRDTRYVLQPYLEKYADFPSGKGKDVLEIGVGLGTDFSKWHQAEPKSLTGIDLTERAVSHAKEHLDAQRLDTGCVHLRQADAESLPFAENSFDIVYSWGVLHHSPDTRKAIREVLRVLRPAGRAVIMIYHRPSLVGLMLWLRYALLAGKITRPLRDVYAQHLESPGTKAYTVEEAREMFAGFHEVRMSIELTNGDLLEGIVGQRHQGKILRLAYRLWPRGWLRRYAKNFGNHLIIQAVK